MAKVLKPKKKSFSEYSSMLDLNIDHFTGTIRDEVASRLDARDAIERNDKTSVERALLQYHPVVTHLITEYRRIKSRWSEARVAFERLEISALNFARNELPAKSTEKQIKLLAYENEGENLYNHRSSMEDLEQKMKVLSDHIDAAKGHLSGLQTASRLLMVEWESGKA